MRREDLDRIRLVLFEPLSEVGGPMTSMLRLEGFSATDHIFSFNALRTKIRSGAADVLLIEADGFEKKVASLVRAVRLMQIEGNPFLPVFLTQTEVTLESTRHFSFSGVDAILDKPYSPSCVLEHIRDLAHRPRTFVICNGYAGPEHRRKPREREECVRLEAPNNLAALMRGEAVDSEALRRAALSWKDMLKSYMPKNAGEDARDGEEII